MVIISELAETRNRWGFSLAAPAFQRTVDRPRHRELLTPSRTSERCAAYIRRIGQLMLTVEHVVSERRTSQVLHDQAARGDDARGRFGSFRLEGLSAQHENPGQRCSRWPRRNLSADITRDLAHSLMNERQREEFAKELECNFSIGDPGCRALSRQRVRPTAKCRHGDQNHSYRDADFRAVRPAGDLQGNRDGQARHGAGGGRHGLGKIDLARRHDRSSQPLLAGPHHHGRRSGRIRALSRRCRWSRIATSVIDTHTWHQALKNTLRQAPDVILIGEIRDCGNHGTGDRFRGNRPSVHEHAAFQQRQPDPRPHHQFLSRTSAASSC